MGKGYAYLDKSNILHVTKDLEDAMQFAKNGRIRDFYDTIKGGYPQREIDVKGKKEAAEVMIYALDRAELCTSEGTKEVNLKQAYPDLYELYKDLSR